MQFALLGPLEVRDGDRAIQIARGKPRALLALLLLRVVLIACALVLALDP